MQSKEQFETSQLIEYKDYEDKSINNISDILALESESGAEGGQRPRNTLPGAWDVIKTYNRICIFNFTFEYDFRFSKSYLVKRFRVLCERVYKLISQLDQIQTNGKN